jgi:SSS family solute:Na+ symporter
LFAGTACLLALVPGSVLLLTAGSIFSRNVVLPLRPSLSEQTGLLVSRASMVAFAGMAVYLAVGGSKSLVEIGLSAYAAIGMLAPGIFLGFLWRRAHAAGVFIGIVAGYLALLLPAAEAVWAAYFAEWDRGLLGMMVATAVTIIVCGLWSPQRAEAERLLPKAESA